VILHGDDVGHAPRKGGGARQPSAGSRFVHPFDNADVIAGQGTMALEILEQTPGVEAVVVPVGWWRLIAGIGTVMKGACAARRGHRRGAGRGGEPHGSAGGGSAAHRAARGPRWPTASRWPASATSPLQTTAVSSTGSSTVDEASIALAILRLIELEKSVVEGAGATRSRHSSPASYRTSKGARRGSRCAAATSTPTCSSRARHRLVATVGCPASPFRCSTVRVALPG